MCTLGAIQDRYLFKNRDMGVDNGLTEDIIHGTGLYKYVGVAGHASPRERGLNSGINEAGVAVAITYVGTETLAQSLESKIPRGVLVEDVLRGAKDLGEAVSIAVTHLNRDAYVGGNIVIAAPEGIASIEELSPRYAVEIIHSPYFVRTNHFHNLVLPLGLLANPDNTRLRYERFSRLLANSGTREFNVEDIRRVLGDHGNWENAICRHGEHLSVTVSSVVYDLRERAMHYLYGLPCSEPYTKYALA